jgi:hypothetical protein
MYQRCILEEGDIIEMLLEFEKTPHFIKKGIVY